MPSPTPKTDALAEAKPSPLEILKSMGAEPFDGKVLVGKLKAAGHVPADALDELHPQHLKYLGKNGKGAYRMRSLLPPDGGDFWLMPQHGPGVRVPAELVSGLVVDGERKPYPGSIKAGGCLCRLTGAQRQELEKRDYPVTVLTKKADIEKAQKAADAKAERLGQKVNKRKEMLEAIGA